MGRVDVLYIIYESFTMHEKKTGNAFINTQLINTHGCLTMLVFC